MKKQFEKYELMLPYTVEILSMIENDNAIDVVEIEQKSTIALQNRYHEWIGFANQRDGMKEALDKIKSKADDQRVIFFSPLQETEVAELISEIPYIKKYHFENFMVCHKDGKKSSASNIRIPSIEEVHRISELNYAYRREEISWRYYQKNVDEIEREYLFRNKYSYVLGLGRPFHSMGEFVAKYKQYRMIGRVFVDKKFRAQGIGKKLVEGMTNYCYENGLIPLLTVREDNDVASHIYGACNFKVEGKVLYCHI